MLARHATPDPTVEALFPAQVDGRPPARRPPPRVADARAVLERWMATGGALR
jgi:hypothetical protein